MLKNLGIQSKKELIENKSLLRLAYFTTWGRSVSNIFLLAWNLNNVLTYKYQSGISILLVFNYFRNIITANNMLLWSILIIVFVVLGYFVIYPMANASVLHMIAKKSRSAEAIGKGVAEFFSFFEFNALRTSFSILTYVITVARLFTLNVLNNGFIIGLVVVWGLLVFLSLFLRPFAKTYIVVEEQPVYTALKKSSSLAISHFGTVIRAIIYQGILTLYFFYRIGIFFIIPTLVMYIVIYFNRFNNAIVSSVLRILGIAGVMLLSYMMAIMYAFFEAYWYKLYLQLTKEKTNKE